MNADPHEPSTDPAAATAASIAAGLPPGLQAHEIDAVMITQKSKSNLAFALSCLPAERRRDMISFYAFCRIVDDIADEPGFSLKERRIQLAAWHRIVTGQQSPPHPVGREVAALPARYGFPAAWLSEIVDGVSMDLESVRFDTYEQLLGYCYKVASVVGLVSLAIFGVQGDTAHAYAINLGYGLQLTNIIRDVKADWDNDQRVYLPQEDLARFGYTLDDLSAHRYTEGFRGLMAFEAQRALQFYEQAIATRPESERHRLVAAEAMRKIYHSILLKMQANGFRVFGPRYRLSRWQKGAIVAQGWLRGWWGVLRHGR
jgi:15-cis-phytoene synthase